MKKDFCFTKFLTNRDIDKILDSVGIELVKNQYNRDGELLKPIIRMKDEDGKTIITVRCQFNEKMKEAMEYDKKDKINIPQSLKNILLLSAMVSTLLGASSWSKYDDMMMLRFEDFLLYEVLSLKDEKTQIEFGRMLTNKYQHYMKEKFGKFYMYKEAAYIKKLRKEVKGQKENEEKTLEKE